MAKSTGFVLTAGALTYLDMVLDGYDANRGLKILVSTVAAAYISGGLDKAAPGLGTGLAVVLLVTSVFEHGPSIADKTGLTKSAGYTVGSVVPDPSALRPQ